MNYRSQNAKDDRSVGYKKPSRESQFKKRQSGNRKGRPRQLTRSKSIAQPFREAARETAEISRSRPIDHDALARIATPNPQHAAAQRCQCREADSSIAQT